MVNQDLWGLPHKILTKQPRVRRPLITIDLLSRLESIVDALFIRRTGLIVTTLLPVQCSSLLLFTQRELLEVASSLPRDKVSWMALDGLLNKLLKAVIIGQLTLSFGHTTRV